MSSTTSSAEALAQNQTHSDPAAGSVPQARPAATRAIAAPAIAAQLRHELAVASFRGNPVSFATEHVISGQGMTKDGALPEQGYAKLVDAGAGVYELRLSEKAAADTVPAHFLGYVSLSIQGNRPAYVDIPKQAEDGKFLFTGTLSGCSVIVTELNPDTLRVFHDSRPNSSTLYDQAVMGTDFKDYQVMGAQEGLANIFMHFSEDSWKLVTQRQEFGGINAAGAPQLKLREECKVVSIQTSDPDFTVRTQAQFNKIRVDSQHKLKNAAAELDIPGDQIVAMDAPYERAEVSEAHPSIASWTLLRNEVRQAAQSEIEAIVEKKHLLPRAENRSPLEQQQFEIHHKYQGHYEQFTTIVEESLTADLTWLREQKKRVEGSNEVVMTGDSNG